MRKYKLEDMVSGWFVGAFEPTSLKTDAAEVAVKTYTAGDSEHRHTHKIATEVTLIFTGQVKMNNQTLSNGDILVLEPGESSDFHAITDATLIVVKLPSVLGDKYVEEVNA